MRHTSQLLLSNFLSNFQGLFYANRFMVLRESVLVIYTFTSHISIQEDARKSCFVFIGDFIAHRRDC